MIINTRGKGKAGTIIEANGTIKIHETSEKGSQTKKLYVKIYKANTIKPEKNMVIETQ